MRGKRFTTVDWGRRTLLRAGLFELGLLSVGGSLLGCGRTLPGGRGGGRVAASATPRVASPVRIIADEVAVSQTVATGTAGAAGAPAVPVPSPGPLPGESLAAEVEVISAGDELEKLTRLPPLQPADANGVRLPVGFSSRIVARSSKKPASGSDYLWHGAPDGGAAFSLSDGGWVYVSNSELGGGGGGVGALRFDASGEVVDAYPILQGTDRNCAGGPTPWGTWLSCEEVAYGAVFECDPLGVKTARARPRLGLYRHEAAAVDVANRAVYLTEDEPDGLLYRFTAERGTGPERPLDLDAGVLEAAVVIGGPDGGRVTWRPVPDPLASRTPTRYQVRDAYAFKGGEGIWFRHGVVYLATKGDDRVWALDTRVSQIAVLYDRARSPQPWLRGVDNLVPTGGGQLLVAEDQGAMQVVALGAEGLPWPLLQVEGQNRSEITGPAFDPAQRRLYFSSQRGITGNAGAGLTYEVTGPFDALFGQM